MLTMVSVDNSLSGTLLLPLEDASGGYVVKDIQGLDPVKATLTSSKMAQMDGAQDQNRRREFRNITMKLGLEPDYVTTSVESLRTGLYDYFMPKSSVTVKFYKDGTLFGKTDAIVEDCQNNQFSAEPQMDISLICYDPDFYAPAESYVYNHTVSDLTTVTIPYTGSTEAGITWACLLSANASEVSLYNTRPDNVVQVLRLLGTFLTNDLITVCTVPGKKAVTVTRAGLTFSVLYWLDHSSNWISLMKGNNLFRAYKAGTQNNWTLHYTSKYGGL